ncbi:MAG: hypothetical protein ACOC2E_05190 [Bacteroidota bacterium]
MLPENVDFSKETQFHTLLHFKETDPAWLVQFLANTDHTAEEAYEMMQKPGSKFYPAFARHPVHLWERISALQKHLTEVKKQGNQKRAFIFQIPEILYPQGIGNDGIINLSDLSAQEKKMMTSTLRNGFEIFSVKLARPLPTWQMNLILETSDERHKIITLFPGTYAPPLPDPDWHTAEQINDYSNFWNQYVFVG